MGGCWRTTPRDDSCITPPIKDEYVRWTCHLPKMCTCFAAPNPRPALFPQASHESGSDGLHSCYRGQANSNACKVASVEPKNGQTKRHSVCKSPTWTKTSSSH
jgi:hypothetical protein